MTTASIYEAKTTLSKLIEKVLHGEEVIISRHGKPVVRLTKCEEKSSPRILGAWSGQVKVGDDFDAPSPEMEGMFYGGGIFPGEEWMLHEEPAPYGKRPAVKKKKAGTVKPKGKK